MTPPMTSTIELTPLDPDGDRHAYRLFRNGRRPRLEQWEARSADGVWHYRREEDATTTWTITHLPTGRQLTHESSLRQARIGTACGWALREMDRREAEQALPRCTWRGRWTAASCSYPVEPGTDRCRDPRHVRT